MPVRFSPFSVDVFTEFLLALPPRESGNGVLALVPVSPSPRKALRQWRGGRLGRSASMTAWAFGAVPKPTGRSPCHEGDPLPVLLEDEADHVARPVGLSHVVVLSLEIPELLHLVILALANRDHPKHSLPPHMARQG